MTIQSSIAANVKEIRSLKGLTLEEASRLTGVSRSMLAQIEKGDVNPTISVLWKIANGFKVSFSSLMEDRSEGAVFVHTEEIVPLEEDEGRYRNYPLFPFREDRLFEIYRIEIDEGGMLHAQPHMVGTEEYITVFAGELEITAEDETWLLKPGDALHFRADVFHSYKNIGSGMVNLSMTLYYNAK